MMKSSLKVNTFFLLLLWTLCTSASPGDLPTTECRPLLPAADTDTGPAQFDRGLLWRVSKNGVAPNYLFGTIHVADDRILDLPEPVSTALRQSRVFVMETVPDVNQVLATGNRMFYHDGGSLDKLVSASIFAKTVTILGTYNLPAEAVAILKPWAAFLTMNYPPEIGTVLDLELLRRAREQNTQAYGLETMDEQIDVLDHLAQADQVRLLVDTVCHYDLIAEEFAALKTLYLERDLRGLVEYSNRYTVADDHAYQALYEDLVIKRNHSMMATMLPHLEQGGAFIAIGAMHLPGEEGVLHLLQQQGYAVTVIY